MMKQDEFVQFVLSGGPQSGTPDVSDETESGALPEGFEGFETAPSKADLEAPARTSFARRLLEASGFGPAQLLDRAEVILGDDPAAKHLSDRVYYWPKAPNRPFQTLLFELDQPGTGLLNAPVFRKLKSQEILEDALARLVQMTLGGFERGGERRTAAVMQGRQDETLCVVSVLDDRDRNREASHLVCLGTKTTDAGSLETFHIREEARFWEPQLADEHLGLLYKRHFSKLSGDRWQNAFISGEERRLARKLLEVCTESKGETAIQVGVKNLLEEIAKGFGLRRKPGADSRLTAFDLPADHDIGADPEAIEKKGGVNPFCGMTLRDERSRLLGYIIYCLDEKRDAAELRKYLASNNRFHNVLVIYPDGDHAVLELWQRTKKLEGKLRKSGAQFEGEGDVVNLLSRFFVVSRSPVSNPTELAQELAYRARYLRRLALRQLRSESRDGNLRALYEEFKAALIHDQSEDDFAGAFAETIAYGLLAARWILKDDLAARSERFTRATARENFPPSSPFLSGFFDSLLKLELGSADTRGKLMWLVEDIADLLDRVDLTEVFGPGDPESDEISDPVIHFYEPFLDAFDAQIKKDRGVFFTPRPVVSFIVRSVDELLRSEFGLEDGLADVTTWGDLAKRMNGLEVPEKVNPSEPFVQILDPATGTGTFLVETIGVMHNTMVSKWRASGCEDETVRDYWQEYVCESLIPRLHGYELLMAPYAIAHLKIVLKLIETGYRFSPGQRARVYLTNSLEPPDDHSGKLAFAVPALATEAMEVNGIKTNKRFTVVIGNPPYSITSANRGNWIGQLAADYKKGLEETNLNALSDDYVKFLRLAQHLVRAGNAGVAGMITNNSYLDGLSHRKMRNLLLGDFDTTVVNLHGSVMRRDEMPAGSADENVFDIQQGVAISLFVRTAQNLNHKVRYADLIGPRESKFHTLLSGAPIDYVSANPTNPYFFFMPKQIENEDEYLRYSPLNDIFEKSSTGISFRKDNLFIKRHFSVESVMQMLEDMKSCSDEEILEKYTFRETKDWKISEKRHLFQDWKPEDIVKIMYRPFDHRYAFYPLDKASQLIVRGDSRVELMRHVLEIENIGLQFNRQMVGNSITHFLVTRSPTVKGTFYLGNKGNDCFAPLYLCSKEDSPRNLTGIDRKSANFSKTFCRELATILAVRMNENGLPDGRSAESIMFYIYSILYSREYRTRFAALLAIDYPRIPLPGGPSLFDSLSRVGERLARVHLLETQGTDNTVAQIGSLAPLRVEKVTYANGMVWIDRNRSCGFDGVPINVWEFHVGGYQVCHKWLNDRKGRTLTDEDIAHYQKIIVAIKETIRIMKEIDEAIDEHGGWPDAFLTSTSSEAEH